MRRVFARFGLVLGFVVSGGAASAQYYQFGNDPSNWGPRHPFVAEGYAAGPSFAAHPHRRHHGHRHGGHGPSAQVIGPFQAYIVIQPAPAPAYVRSRRLYAPHAPARLRAHPVHGASYIGETVYAPARLYRPQGTYHPTGPVVRPVARATSRHAPRPHRHGQIRPYPERPIESYGAPLGDRYGYGGYGYGYARHHHWR